MMQKKRLLRNQKQRYPQSRFRFLSKCRTTRPKQKTSSTSIRQQIIKYKEELLHPITEDTGTDFGLEKSDKFLSQFKAFCVTRWLCQLLMLLQRGYSASQVTSQEDGATEEESHWSEVLSLK